MEALSQCAAFWRRTTKRNSRSSCGVRVILIDVFIAELPGRQCNRSNTTIPVNYKLITHFWGAVLRGGRCRVVPGGTAEAPRHRRRSWAGQGLGEEQRAVLGSGETLTMPRGCPTLGVGVGAFRTRSRGDVFNPRMPDYLRLQQVNSSPIIRAGGQRSSSGIYLNWLHQSRTNLVNKLRRLRVSDELDDLSPFLTWHPYFKKESGSAKPPGNELA